LAVEIQGVVISGRVFPDAPLRLVVVGYLSASSVVGIHGIKIACEIAREGARVSGPWRCFGLRMRSGLPSGAI
jgi:DMSO/TMAO reductase YedYZ molybdopterin-dependent catalytic subunit